MMGTPGGLPAALPAPLSTVIVEDEPLARLHLRDLVQASASLQLVGEATNGPDALALIDAQRPAVLFLDIQLPVFDGLTVLERCTHHPHVVFTTAYDGHAVTAFELGAADYLLKPFDGARFARAVERVLRAVQTPAGGQAEGGPTAVARVRELFGDTTAGVPLRHLYIRERGTVRPLAVAQVERLEADDDYVHVVHGGARSLVTVALSELLSRLDPHRFVRVHRSHAVNLDYVRALEPHDAGRWAVLMRDGTRIVASRTGTRQIRAVSRLRGNGSG